MNENNHVFLNPIRKVEGLTKHRSVPSPISVTEFSCLCSHGNGVGEKGNGIVLDAFWLNEAVIAKHLGKLSSPLGEMVANYSCI